MMKNGATYKFKKNESFYIRDGWFEKALNEIADKNVPNVFSKNLGSKILGIGSNMAKGLKYWLQVANIIEPLINKTELTEFGKCIRDHDRYFESDFTWYLVHMFLCSNKYECPVFYAVFNSGIKKIKKAELANLVMSDISDDSFEVKPSYVEDDLSIFLKSYLRDDEVYNPEDNYVCPLSSLKLLKKNGEFIEKQRPILTKLSYLIVYYSLSVVYKFNSFNIEDSFGVINGPIHLFNLDKNCYLQYLDEMQRNGLITINKTAGLNAVYFEKKLTLRNIFEANFGRLGK